MISAIFELELQKLINSYSMENGCNTPDFILSRYLCECLEQFNAIVNERERWYGRPKHQLVNLESIGEESL